MARIPVAALATFMLVFGSINTIATKFQDQVIVGQDKHSRSIFFKHPVIQTAAMFAGESLCLVIFLLKKWLLRGPSEVNTSPEEKAIKRERIKRASVWFALPTVCDAGATTLLNLGLYYTYASAFQMLRGTMVIFAGIMTMVILRRPLKIHHWTGILLIMVGAALVGAANVLMDAEATPTSGASNPLLGDTLVVIAQVLTATQFIIEEKYLAKFHAPVLFAVGMEGVWGLVLVAAFLPVLNGLHGPDGQPLDDVIGGIKEIKESTTLQWTFVITVFSIGLFNFFGVSVTKRLSGSARATIDACRTLVIWLFALWAGWENFHMLTVVGFAVLLSGTSVYNEIIAYRRRLNHHHGRFADDVSVSEPLLLSGAPTGEAPTRTPSVTFSFPQPRMPPRPKRQSKYTMARSVTILPVALSPHSLTSDYTHAGSAYPSTADLLEQCSSSVDGSYSDESYSSDGSNDGEAEEEKEERV